MRSYWILAGCALACSQAQAQSYYVNGFADISDGAGADYGLVPTFDTSYGVLDSITLKMRFTGVVITGNGYVFDDDGQSTSADFVWTKSTDPFLTFYGNTKSYHAPSVPIPNTIVRRATPAMSQLDFDADVTVIYDLADSDLSIFENDGDLVIRLTGANGNVEGLFDPGQTGVFVPYGFYDRIDYTLTYNVAAVPEPASWGLMISGFGLVGRVIRRRSRAPSFPRATTDTLGIEAGETARP